MDLSEFDFELPPERIAQSAIEPRSAARLLDGTGSTPMDRSVTDLPDLLDPGDVLVVNDTRVAPVQVDGGKETGGRLSGLLIEYRDGLARLLLRGRVRPGDRVVLGGVEGTVVERQDEWATVRLPRCPTGTIPLPPYFKGELDDPERYQTIFADRLGAVAAPTAGLHFDAGLLDALVDRGIRLVRITLHIGPATFMPVRAERIEDHAMGPEWFEIPDEALTTIAAAASAGQRVVAVGTTVVRALETCFRSGGEPGTGTSRLFLYPGTSWHSPITHLLTNFHLPKTTLLMLVSGFAGLEHIRSLYAHAITEDYRFYSFGDCMLLRRADEVGTDDEVGADDRGSK